MLFVTYLTRTLEDRERVLLHGGNSCLPLLGSRPRTS
jgi:hypothetical protein